MLSVKIWLSLNVTIKAKDNVILCNLKIYFGNLNFF